MTQSETFIRFNRVEAQVGPLSKEAVRKELNEDISRYLADGKTITKIPTGISGYKDADAASHQYRMYAIRGANAKHGKNRRRDS